MIFDEIFATIKDYRLLLPDDKIVVGVSGGADSVCLLCALDTLRKSSEEFQHVEIFAIHVHHGIRGTEADRDASFVEMLCKKKHIPERTVYINVPELAKFSGFSEEETGRRERYRIFEEIRCELGFTKIAVAHNSDDLAETFILNLARGTGLAGLSGIKPVNGQVIRPLIRTSRAAIERMLFKAGETHITDSTNLSDDYTRNRIRHSILPELAIAVNAKAAFHIDQAAEKIGQAYDFIKEEAAKASERVVIRSENGQAVEISNELTKLHPVVQSEIIHDVLAEIAGRMRDISTVHIDLVRDLFTKQTGACVDVIYNIRLTRTYTGVRYRNGGRAPVLVPILDVITVPRVHSVEVTSDGLRIICIDKDGAKTEKFLTENSCTKWFDYDKIVNSMSQPIVRTRQTGDYMIIDTEGHRKKLKDIFINEKVPRETRDTLLLVAAGHEILFIPGVRKSENARITKGTTKLLKVTGE